MKTPTSTTKKILATLGLLWLLLPAICLGDSSTPATPPAGSSTPATQTPTTQTGSGTVKESDLFYQFSYTDPKANTGTKIAAVNALPKKDWQSTLTGIIKILLNISGGLTLLSFTVGGVMMIISQGNGDLLEKGKRITYYSVAGLVIIAVSYALVIGVSELNLVAPGSGAGGNNPTSGQATTPAAPATPVMGTEGTPVGG